MNIDQRMDRWERRQEALIASISGQTDVMVTTRDMLAELMTWLQKPPSSDLPDLIRALTLALTSVQEQVIQHGAEVRNLGRKIGEVPAEVARAIRTGEVA
jgi:hypothetical protein